MSGDRPVRVRCVVDIPEARYRALQHGAFMKGGANAEPWSEPVAAEVRWRLYGVRNLAADPDTQTVDEADYLAQKQKEMAEDD